MFFSPNGAQTILPFYLAVILKATFRSGPSLFSGTRYCSHRAVSGFKPPASAAVPNSSDFGLKAKLFVGHASVLGIKLLKRLSVITCGGQTANHIIA